MYDVCLQVNVCSERSYMRHDFSINLTVDVDSRASTFRSTLSQPHSSFYRQLVYTVSYSAAKWPSSPTSISDCPHGLTPMQCLNYFRYVRVCVCIIAYTIIYREQGALIEVYFEQLVSSLTDKCDLCSFVFPFSELRITIGKRSVRTTEFVVRFRRSTRSLDGYVYYIRECNPIIINVGVSVITVMETLILTCVRENVSYFDSICYITLF